MTLKLSEGKYECVNNVIKYVVEASVEPASAALNVRYLLDGVAHNNTRFELDVDLQTNTTKSYVISVIHKVAGHGECRKDSAPILVAPKTPLKAQADKITSVSCHDGADGSFEVVAQGGSGKYEYGLKQADGSYRWQGTNNQFKNLSVGSYTVGVKDTEYGCIYEVVNTAIIAPTPILITQNSITHVGCKGRSQWRDRVCTQGEEILSIAGRYSSKTEKALLSEVQEREKLHHSRYKVLRLVNTSWW